VNDFWLLLIAAAGRPRLSDNSDDEPSPVATMIVGLAVMGIIVIFHVAMEMPMTTLIEGISGRR